MKPGFGVRHPVLAAILASDAPVARHRIEWFGGTLPLQVSAYTSIRNDLPDEVLTSVRCIVRVDEQVVMCQTRDNECHVLPGGRRNDGESFVQTAVREVHEETGWLLRSEAVHAIGWLHLEILNDTPFDPELPYPDFLQLVMCGIAEQRDGGRDIEWTDVEGHETSSRLVSVREAYRSVSNDLLDRVFLELMLNDLC